MRMVHIRERDDCAQHSFRVRIARRRAGEHGTLRVHEFRARDGAKFSELVEPRYSYWSETSALDRGQFQPLPLTQSASSTP